MPPTEVKLDDCSKDTLFKAVSDVRKDMKCNLKTVKDMHCRANCVVHVADTSDGYIPKTDDAIKLSKIGNPTFKDWLPEHLCYNKIFHVDDALAEDGPSDEDTSLQAAMMANTTSGGSHPRKPETQDRATASGYQDRAGAGGYQGRAGAGGGLGHTWNQHHAELQTPVEEMDMNARILSAPNDLNSDVGIIKKVITLSVQPASAQLRSADAQPRRRTAWRSAEQENQPPQKSVKFAGVARKGPKGPKVAVPRPLTHRTVTISDSDSEVIECAGIDMVNPMPKAAYTSYRAMNAIPRTALLPGIWKQGPTDTQHSEGEARLSELSAMSIKGTPAGKLRQNPYTSGYRNVPLQQSTIFLRRLICQCGRAI